MNTNLKEIRNSKKLTQEEAALILGISRRSYISYEKGNIDFNKPKYAYILKLLNEYGKIDENHGILTIEEIKKCCSNILKDYKVDFCYLFGSYSKGNPSEKSDIDLLISMPNKSKEYFELIERLREELKKKIDLIHITQLSNNLELTKEIFKNGIKIYG